MNMLPRLANVQTWSLLEISVLAQVTVIVLVAHVVARLALRHHGAARHGLWLGALGCVLMSPVVAVVADSAGWKSWAVSLSLPVTEIIEPRSQNVSRDEVASPLTESLEPGQRVEPSLSAPIGLAHESVAEDRITENTSAAPLVVTEKPRSVQGRISWNTALGGLTVLWGAGIVFGVARVVMGYVRVASMIRAARPLDSARHGEALAQARAALEVAELPPVVVSDWAAGPLAVGVFRPRVVLPDGLADALTTRVLRDVLVHECAHLLRRDPWIGLLQRLAAALVWPHPLVHSLNGQLSRAREEVCDNFALRCSDPCGYSRTLLTLTELCRSPRYSRVGLGILTSRWTLTDRVAGLLDPGRMTMTHAKLRTRLALTALLVAAGSIVASVRWESQVKAADPVVQGKEPATGKVNSSMSHILPALGIAWNIRGIVVDEQGRPVAGAVVRLPESTRQAGVGVSKTAADGTFSLDVRPLGFVRSLLAEVDGGSRVGLVRNEPRVFLFYRPNASVRIVVKPTRTVTVRVRDASGAPVAGASIAAIEPTYQTTSSTGADGLAILRVAADAQIAWVMGQKSGVGFDYFENYRSARATEFENLRTPGVTEVVPLPAEVSLTLDGAQTIRVKAFDSNNRPLPGIRFDPVTIYKPAKIAQAETFFSSISQVATDAQGIAVFDWLPKNARRFFFSIRSEEYSSPRGVEYRQGGPTELTLKLFLATRLSGTVRLPDGQAARGVVVRAQWGPNGPQSMGARTGDDGTYSIDVPPETLYAVAVEDENWTAPSRMGVFPKEGQPQSGLDFTLAPGTILRGQITEGPDHTPAKGADILLDEHGPVLPKELRTNWTSARLVRRIPADENGRYQLRVAPGRYTLRVFDGSDSLTIEVKSEPEIVRDLALKKSSAQTYFNGVVVEKTPTGERPVANAVINTLSADEDGGGIMGRSDEQGRFRSIRRPNMVLFAHSQGLLAGFMSVPEGANDVKLVVSPSVKVTGRVVDSNGKPQPNRFVLVGLDFGSDPHRSAHHRLSTRTNAEGRFTYAGSPVGTQGECSVNHEKDGRPTGARTVVSFNVPVLEPVEVTDLIVPASEAPKE